MATIKQTFWAWSCSRHGPRKSYGVVRYWRGGGCPHCHLREATAEEVLTAEANGRLYKDASEYALRRRILYTEAMEDADGNGT